jgi:palmitoyltransferase ZDHHC9/14/18
MPGPPPPNPFSHGNWRRNLLAVLCRPQGYSWLDASGVVTEDKRQVNPGLLGETSTPGVAVARRSGEGVNGHAREGDWEDDGGHRHQDE